MSADGGSQSDSAFRKKKKKKRVDLLKKKKKKGKKKKIHRESRNRWICAIGNCRVMSIEKAY
jgi:hypothetical protein